MRTLVLGGTGMLGRAVAAECRRRGWTALAVGRGHADITDRVAVHAVAAAFRPQLLVNCAALTRVDDCENEGAAAFAVNGAAVANVVEVARSLRARLLHVSSDYVFDGSAESPYREDAATAPLSIYGASKLAGERAALAYERATVVRSSWLFGAGGPNFVSTMLKLQAKEQPLRVVSDQLGCPTYTPFLARALCDLAPTTEMGVVHYRNREAVSWHGFATAIVERWRSFAGSPALAITAVSTAEFPRPAARPAYSVLDVGRFESAIGRRVEPWEWGLSEYLNWMHERRQ
jgi:dTDP-4-dehydrorhamnose reductase